MASAKVNPWPKVSMRTELRPPKRTERPISDITNPVTKGLISRLRPVCRKADFGGQFLAPQFRHASDTCCLSARSRRTEARFMGCEMRDLSCIGREISFHILQGRDRSHGATM